MNIKEQIVETISLLNEKKQIEKELSEIKKEHGFNFDLLKDFRDENGRIIYGTAFILCTLTFIILVSVIVHIFILKIYNESVSSGLGFLACISCIFAFGYLYEVYDSSPIADYETEKKYGKLKERLLEIERRLKDII